MAAGTVLAYCVLVAVRIDQQWPPDFAAFYSIARALGTGGLGAVHLMYSIHFQEVAEASVQAGAGRVYFEPFMNPWPAAVILIPFTALPLRAAFLIWDTAALAICAAGTYWLCKDAGLGADATLLTWFLLASYPVYLALGVGQYDLLWPACLALFTAALTTSRAGKRLARSAVAILLFSFKPDLLLALVVPGMRAWKRRAVREAGVLLLVLALAVLLAMGPGGVTQAIHLEAYALLTRFPPLSDITVLGLLWHILGPGRPTQLLATGVSLLVLVSFAWLWWRDPPRTRVGWCLSLTSAVCLSLAIAPHALSHDLVLLVGPMVWTARALRESGRSLAWMWVWYGLFNAVVLVDGTPLLRLPVSLTFVLLIGASAAAWWARGSLRGGAVPVQREAGAMRPAEQVPAGD